MSKDVQTIVCNQVTGMGDKTIQEIEAVQDWLMTLEQAKTETKHLLFAGMYARTWIVPAGLIITGVLIKKPTIITMHGDIDLWIEGAWKNFSGYQVLEGHAPRCQIGRTNAETHFTMLFPTAAETVKQAEEEFTDECHKLLTRK